MKLIFVMRKVSPKAEFDAVDDSPPHLGVPMISEEEEPKFKSGALR